MSLVAIIFFIFLFLVLMAACVVLFFWQASLAFTRAPYIAIPDEILLSIVDALALNPDSRLFDLGCGDGRILHTAKVKTPEATFVGIERALFPYWIARFQTRNDSIDIKRQNFFHADLSSATHVFTYLFPGLMNDLLPKLEKELKPGTKLVSCDYGFEKKEPVSTINLARPENTRGKTLFVYEF